MTPHNLTPQYLRVKNWERFQHYKDRRPVWIKLHVELIDDYGLSRLDPASRLLYMLLLLVAARTDNNIPNDSEHLFRLTAIPAKQVAASLQKLLDAGFLVVSERKRSASKAIAKRQQPAFLETETETETETDAVLDKPKASGSSGFLPYVAQQTLGTERAASFARLMDRVKGGDGGTPKVVMALCKQLPAEHIDAVVEHFAKRKAPAGTVVNALKAAIADYEDSMRDSA